MIGGADIPFSDNGPLSGVSHTAGSTTFTVAADGVYKVTYSVNLTAGIGAFLTVAVNGSSQPGSVVPVLVATGHVSGVVLLSLAAGDVLTVRNSSAVPMVLALAHAVGAQVSIERLQ